MQLGPNRSRALAAKTGHLLPTWWAKPQRTSETSLVGNSAAWPSWNHREPSYKEPLKPVWLVGSSESLGGLGRFRRLRGLGGRRGPEGERGRSWKEFRGYVRWCALEALPSPFQAIHLLTWSLFPKKREDQIAQWLEHQSEVKRSRARFPEGTLCTMVCWTSCPSSFEYVG